MKRRTNIINNILALALTMGALLAVLMICNYNYSYENETFQIVGFLLLGAIIAGFIVAVSHELGHLLAGKRNGFKFQTIAIWFFKWTKVGKRTVFSFTLPLEEAGYTEMFPTASENMAKRYAKMTRGGIYGPLVLMLIGAVALFFPKIPLILFSVWSMLLPLGAYYLFGNLLPTSSYGVYNDGAVLYSLKKQDDIALVTTALLIFQAEMYNGKTPSEIDENLLFDLPQLPEDQPVYAMLLDARYNYYLDKEDYENAKLVSLRLASILDYMPKHIKFIAQTNALYNACTFDFNEEKADDLMYELEKFLNRVNTTLTVRAKLAYLVYVAKQTENAEIFFKKGIREAKRSGIKGLCNFEMKLFDKIKNDF